MTPEAKPRDAARTGAVAYFARDGKNTADEPIAVDAAAAMTSPNAFPLLEDLKSMVSSSAMIAMCVCVVLIIDDWRLFLFQLVQCIYSTV